MTQPAQMKTQFSLLVVCVGRVICGVFCPSGSGTRNPFRHRH
ncbi:hypothetical protein FTUN_2332 [Frigoriglobus tundricola]|uniref:Uncharacterized protein n=1 Tax=Frigoriglobus tundricola TaxID=2774151 RepID=A0A6M5YLG1_9BACT|nr:hypothetical protein FTUN_2332 [Frigoriglobus tundricola]